MRYNTYSYTIIFIVVGYIQSADKLSDDTGGESGYYADDEEDNFDTKEIIEQLEVSDDNIDEEGFQTIVSQLEIFLIDDDKQNAKPEKPSDKSQKAGAGQPEETVGDEEVIIRNFKKGVTCDEITLMKKNSVGELVKMTEEDYKKTFDNLEKVNYELKSELEQILCDGDLVYIYSDEDARSKSVTFYKLFFTFVIRLETEFIFIKNSLNKWVEYENITMYHFNFFSQNDEGKEILITPENYSVDLTGDGTLKYVFLPNVHCTRVEYYDMFSWKKSSKDDYLLALCFTFKKNIILHFKEYFALYEINDSGYYYSLRKTIFRITEDN